MKLIKPSVNTIPYDYYINQIANAAHLCYKQESSTTPNDKFVQSLINRQHLTMLEHGTIYLTVPYDDLDNTHEEIDALIKRYEKNPYSKVFAYSEHDDKKFNRTIFVTTNYRVIIENKWQDDLQFISLPSVHEKRYAFHVVTDRATATQLLRHRSMSFAMESQRFCNYSKDKFDNQVTFVIPSFLDIKPCNISYSEYWDEKLSAHFKDLLEIANKKKETIFIESCLKAEQDYLNLLNNGCKPEEARCVLPNSTKTELILTGFKSDWRHLLDSRFKGLTGKPQSDIKLLTEPINNYFCNL